MKKAFAIGLIFLCGCVEEADNVISFNAYLDGTVFYRDMLTGETVTDESGITVILAAEDNSDLPRSFEDTLRGPTFRFGPLDGTKTYTIRARYTDPSTNVSYEGFHTTEIMDEDIDVEMFPAVTSYLLTGTASYMDVLESRQISDQEKIKTVIRNQRDLLINGQPSASFEGPEFRFTGLLKGEVYLLTSTYVDETNKVVYHAEHPITMNNSVENVPMQLIPTSNSVILKGAISYTDLLTNKRIDEETGIHVALRRADGLLINGHEQLTSEGSGFVFNGLSTDVPYLLQAGYTDANGARYRATDDVEFESAETVHLTEIQLEWVPATTAIVTMTDQLGNPVEGAQIFAYNNYDLLAQYKASGEASVNKGLTNRQGKVLFSDLNPVPHFFYGLRIIDGDSTDTFDAAFDPATVGPLNQNEVNNFVISITD